jgi:BolA family transcriptional regulator, general stress-responsive regulator
MQIQQSIEQLLSTSLNPIQLEVVNESHMHSVPPNSETHFKVTLVAEAFDGLNQVKRHQQVYALLRELMQNPIHALALHTYSPNEWAVTQGVPSSPPCMGGQASQ